VRLLPRTISRVELTAGGPYSSRGRATACPPSTAPRRTPGERRTASSDVWRSASRAQPPTRRWTHWPARCATRCPASCSTCAGAARASPGGGAARRQPRPGRAAPPGPRARARDRGAVAGAAGRRAARGTSARPGRRRPARASARRTVRDVPVALPLGPPRCRGRDVRRPRVPPARGARGLRDGDARQLHRGRDRVSVVPRATPFTQQPPWKAAAIGCPSEPQAESAAITNQGLTVRGRPGARLAPADLDDLGGCCRPSRPTSL
jgi:hypothetical protein